MGPITCVREAAALVFVGAFNPAIYQPRWFGRVGVLQEKDADGAVVNAILPDLASFRAADWLDFQATPVHMQLTTDKVENALLLRDAAQNLFRVLEHTPLREAGINRLMHFRYPAASDRMDLGQRLASPKEWPRRLQDPLMLSLTVQAKRPGSDAVLKVTVEPSTLAEIEQPFGVYVQTNEHFVAKGGEDAMTFVNRVCDSFHDAFTFARQVAEDLLEGKRGV